MAAPRAKRRRRPAPPRGTAYEKALLEAQREASPDGVLVVGPDGRILSHNRRFVELWRIPQEVMAAKDDDAAIASVLDRVRDPQAFQARIREIYARPCGTAAPSSATRRPCSAPGRAVSGACGTSAT
jgi:PAS domain-containing protein